MFVFMCYTKLDPIVGCNRKEIRNKFQLLSRLLLKWSSMSQETFVGFMTYTLSYIDEIRANKVKQGNAWPENVPICMQ